MALDDSMLSSAEEQDGLGPIDYLVFEFEAGQVHAEDFAVLLEAVDAGAVRVLDLEFIVKDHDGRMRKAELPELAERARLDLTIWEGVASGLLDESDVVEVGSTLAPGRFAAIVIYENLSILAVTRRVAAHGLRLIADGRIPPEAVLEALDAADAADQLSDRPASARRGDGSGEGTVI